MANSSEGFRNELVSKLLAEIPQDQLSKITSVLDSTLSDYDVTRKPMSLITIGGIPEVVKYFLASKAVANASDSTLHIYKLRLVDFFTMCKKSFQDITTNDIRMYLYYYKDKRSAADSYLDNIRRILNSFFSWLVKNEYIVRNPCANVDHIKYHEKEREPLTSYQLEELRWNCDNVREKAIIDFFFSTGVRLSELRNLNKEDVDWDVRSAIIRHGKGDKQRIVFFNAESALSLHKYLESRLDENEALFVGSRNPHNRLSNKAIQNIIANVANRTGLHVYPHKLRHTFATSGLRGGMPLEKLQALMGHAEPKTTLIYAKIDKGDLQREHSRIYA